MFPKNYRFTREHEWVSEEDGVCVVGITSYAAEQLGDITFVELPDTGIEFERGDAIATVESVKAASDVYAPISGRVVEVNTALEAQPELVNQSPFDEGWFLRIENGDAAEMAALMDATAYEQFVAEERE